jgi:deoxyribonuclease-4
MLIGAHVSQAGGLDKAVERGVERGCRSIQIFNQSPRMWRPTRYEADDFAVFRSAMDDSRIDAVLIHAVYLINCASEDAEIRTKSLASLKQSLHVADGIGANVVLHPGSALRGHVGEAIGRAGEVFREALAESDSSLLLLEDTAGTGGTLGRSFEELRELIDAAGGGERLGVCLDSCHLLASGYDVRSIDALAETLDRFDDVVGLDRLGAVHLNDSQTPLGSNRDRHANLGEGEIGEDGITAFLSEPRFEQMPVVLETPGPDKRGTSAEEIAYANRLRRRGLKARRG